MIQIFSHYVPTRLMGLVVLETVALSVAAYFAISLNLMGSQAALPGFAHPVLFEAALFSLGMVIVMSSMGLYEAELLGNALLNVRLLIAILTGSAIAILIWNMTASIYPRPLELGALIMVFALMSSVLVRIVYSRWTNLGKLKSRILVLGTGSRVMRLAEHAKNNPNHQVIGFISPLRSTHYVPLQQVLPMGAEDSLLSIVERHAIDQIVVGVRDRRGGGFPMEQLLECRMKGVPVLELPTFFEREYRQVLLESLNPSWMVLGEGFGQGFGSAAVTRLVDITASTVILVLALPIMLITALCIYLESGLPVLYRQDRVGKGGHVFTLYKFRSMGRDAENGGTPHWAKPNDDRTTRVGRFIRKYRIDELPQIFNVLKGEMSFVGPRPERPFFVEQLAKQIPFYALRHSVKPGITGWAQVRYQYGASIDDAIEKLQYDLYYVKNHGLFLDLMILISTVEVVLWGKGAR